MAQTTAAKHLPKDDPAYPHHTARGYRGGCRQHCCRTGRYNADAARRRRAEAGDPSLQAVEPLREHVESLLRAVPAAMPQHVAIAANISPTTVSKIRRGGSQQADRGVREAILALTPQDVDAACPWVLPHKARQVVHSLAAQGWALRWIAEQLGYGYRVQSPPFCWTVKAQKRMAKTMHEKVMALAERIGDSTGPHDRARLMAEEEGWLPLRFYDADGNRLPDDEVEDAVPGDEVLLDDPDAERSTVEWAALRRLCALRRIILDGTPPTNATELHRTTLSSHWRHLHVQFRATQATRYDPSVVIPPTPAERPYVEVIRAYVEVIPISDCALALGDWSEVDVPLSYDPLLVQDALYADLLVLADGWDPRTGEPVAVAAEAPSPAAEPATVTKLKPHENRTPWRTEPAVIPGEPRSA